MYLLPLKSFDALWGNRGVTSRLRPWKLISKEPNIQATAPQMHRCHMHPHQMCLVRLHQDIILRDVVALPARGALCMNGMSQGSHPLATQALRPGQLQCSLAVPGVHMSLKDHGAHGKTLGNTMLGRILGMGHPELGKQAARVGCRHYPMIGTQHRPLVKKPFTEATMYRESPFLVAVPGPCLQA